MKWVLGLGLAAGIFSVASLGFTAWMSRKVEKIVPASGRFLNIAGQRVHFLDQGDGPAIVLIHGLGGQSANFSHSLLERLTDRFRVIVIDRPGSGHSPPFLHGKSSLKRQASLVAGLIKSLHLDRPLIVGHSLGGAVALALALDEPDLVSGLALVAPLSQAQKDVPEAFRLLAIRSSLLRRLVGWIVATPASMIGGQRALTALFGPEPIPKNFATRGGGLLSLRPSAYLAATADLAAAEEDMASLVSRYGALRLPIGVLFGKGDRILDPRLHGEGLRARIPGLDLRLIEGGHMLPITASEATASLIHDTHARSR